MGLLYSGDEDDDDDGDDMIDDTKPPSYAYVAVDYRQLLLLSTMS